MIRTDLAIQGGGRKQASVSAGLNPPVTLLDGPRLRPRTGLETPPVLAPFRLAEAKKTPLSIRVPGVARDIRVKIASERAEWRDAFQLVSCNYQARGYEEPFASKVRFTPYHALPDVVTLVAKLEDAGRWRRSRWCRTIRCWACRWRASTATRSRASGDSPTRWPRSPASRPTRTCGSGNSARSSSP